VIKRRIEIGQTAATIICEDDYFRRVVRGISRARRELERYIGDYHPEFLFSLEPIEPRADAPEIVENMCLSSSKAKVGPMAAVAGAIAEAGVKSALKAGSRHCIVDNGGDIAMVLDRPINVGILDRLESDRIPTVEIGPTDGAILGLCTSSGQFGHSISFGQAEAATVMAEKPTLADAFATKLGNACKDRISLQQAFESLSGIDEVVWAIARVDGSIGTLGNPPNLRYCNRDAENITVHSYFPRGIINEMEER